MEYPIPMFQKNIQPQYSIVLKQEKPKEPEKPKSIEYVVQKGDTLEKIAIATNSSVERLYSKNTTIANPNVINPGDVIVVPQTDEMVPVREAPKVVTDTKTVKISGSTAGNTYTPLYCTWYVKDQRSDIPNSWGDAYQWLGRAQRDGWSTGPDPKIGAVAWARNYGHVALVRDVKSDQVLVEEMNYQGLGIVSSRWTKASEFSYIY